MNLSERTIGELVAEDYRRAGVFKKFGIDFCCGGGRTVRAACEKRGLSVAEIEQALETAVRGPSTEQTRPDTWELDFLADYIVNVHHTYVRENIPLLLEFTRKVARVHGGGDPSLVEIAVLFEKVARELIEHTAKEESTLFPYIKTLVAAQRASTATPTASGSVREPIALMEHEHDQAGALMQAIRQLSNDFTPPTHACNTYRVSFAKLAEFEEDLHRHVHLENNILFPKAIALEASLTAGQAA